MPRYWVIAPVESKPPELFDKVWQFNRANNLISIGWKQLGDVSNMTREELSGAVAATYPEKPPATQSLIANMFWAFYHEISSGDFVLARRGRKVLAAVGRVTQSGVSPSAFYAPGKNPTLDHPNYLQVSWQEQPRPKVFPAVVFPMHTLAELSEEQFRNFLEGSGVQPVLSGELEEIKNPYVFVLEKYLEDFIVSNFNTIFKGELKIYEDEEGNDGQQYATDIGPIDILAVEPKSKSFVVIELKKGRSSDQVVGQVLRYMGWAKEKLCSGSQAVKGLAICPEPDPTEPDLKLKYALSMTSNIGVQYYSVSFALRMGP